MKKENKLVKKNMKNKFVENRGITIIALIITVIVLLLLAGVTINLTIGENGIFKTAQLAAKNYTNAQEKELANLAEFNNTLNDTIEGQAQEEKEQLITEITLNKTEINLGVGSIETLTATISPDNAANKNLTWTSSNTEVATVSEGTITAIAGGTTTITATAQDGSGKNASCTVLVPVSLASKAKPGDYVEYDGGNEYTGLWQVLYNDSTYGLQIISSDTVTDSFTLGGDTYTTKGKDDYNNAVNLLNTECRKYVNSSYAISGRCVGTNPLSPDDTATTTDWIGNHTMKNADTNYTSDYDAMTKAISQNTSGINNIGKYYWLASRDVYNDGVGDAYFHLFCVYADGRALRYNQLCRIHFAGGYVYSGYGSMGIRPAITLKSGIQTSEGNGSENTPYKLVAQ